MCTLRKAVGASARALAGLVLTSVLAAQQPALRVYGEDEACQDARLTRAARTTDTPVRFEPPATLAEWDARAEELRLRIRVAAGIFPAPPRTARLETHGLVDRGDYTVERAWFESQPGHFVTASLYRPKGGPARKPGVLCPHGHWTNGRLMERTDAEARAQVEHGDERSLAAAKYPLQARCAQLARMGCVVLQYDMLGFGDARQFDHDLSFASVEDALRLQSLFGFQTWNSLCALDALCALPDVDPERIGVTGASGGGSQTFVLAAIDERVKVALPAVMVSEHFQGGCRCENGPHLRIGTGNVELAGLMAPRPLAFTGANDWTIDLEAQVLPPLKQLYALYDAGELVTGRCWPQFEHNYNLPAREYLYEFFAEHLGLEHEGPIAEPDFVPLTPAELSVFDAEHAGLPERARPAAEVQAAFARECDAALAALVESAPQRFVRELRAALGVLLSTGPVDAPLDCVASLNAVGSIAGAAAFPRVLARRHSGEAVPVLLVTKPPRNGTVVVCVSERGKEDFLAPGAPALADVRALLDAGASLVLLDPLFTGESAGGSMQLARDDGRDASYHGFTDAYNRTLIAERVHDVLTAIDFARTGFTGTPHVHVLGVGRAGAWALLASALAGDAVERTAVSFDFDFDDVRSFADPDFLPGGLRYGGLAGFAAAIAPRELWLVGAEAAPEAPKLLRRAYQLNGCLDHLHLVPASDAARVLERIAGGVAQRPEVRSARSWAR